MFKLFFVACVLGLTMAAPKPKPDLVYTEYTAPVAYHAPISAYHAPISTYHSLPVAATYHAAAVPVAYSTEHHTAPFTTYSSYETHIVH